MVSSCCAWLVAQQFPGAELGNVTATAILGWYAWHTASRTIPGLLADFRSELAAARGDHRADCEMFRAELAAERSLRHDDQLRLLEALQEMTDRWARASGPRPELEEMP